MRELERIMPRSGNCRISVFYLINISFNLSEFDMKEILGEMIWGTY
jgi:hypothetical protein